jgi:AcrR family transcriptional regulator
MFTEMSGRVYRKRQRALQQEETRLRIVEAAMALHEELGPRATSIAAIAERAGVQRLTVYRHFADAEAIFRACTTHWLSLNPPPDPSDWQQLARPRARTEAALAAVYAYYRRTARMWSRAYRDVSDVAAMQEPMARFEDYLAGIRANLAEAWSRGRAVPAQLDAGLALALHFRSWEVLAARGLNDKAMATMMAAACSQWQRAQQS